MIGWLLLSFVLFMVSAQVNDAPSGRTKEALSNDGTLLTGSTILVLGSDQRTGASIDKTQAGPSRADSIQLIHASLGSVRKLAIPRDAAAEIPGHGTQKINAAYALGGPALMVETVEGFLGPDVKISHLIEVDFEEFPEFIDALGGITVNSPTRICSPEFDNFYKGLRFKKGENKVNGREALGFARVRKNNCAPNENDIDRAARQQEVMSGVRRKLLSPTTFVRLPWVAWKAPRALRTDLKGPGLLALAGDVATGSSDETNVLEPSCLGCGPAGGLVVSEGERRDEASRLVDGE